MKIKFTCPFCKIDISRSSSIDSILRDKAIRILMEDVKDHILLHHMDKIVELEDWPCYSHPTGDKFT